LNERVSERAAASRVDLAVQKRWLILCCVRFLMFALDQEASVLHLKRFLAGKLQLPGPDSQKLKACRHKR
jgi:hypothetical protein